MLKFLVLLFLFISLSFSKEINLDKIIKDSSKESIVYLHRVGCSYCNSMDEFTLDDDNVKNFIKDNFNFISINVTYNDDITFKGKKYQGIEFAKAVGYNFYPSMLFYGNDTNLDYVSVGYKDEDDFLIILKYVQDKKYELMPIQRYKKLMNFKKNEESIVDKRKNGS